jgi:hypothetical protein
LRAGTGLAVGAAVDAFARDACHAESAVGPLAVVGAVSGVAVGESRLAGSAAGASPPLDGSAAAAVGESCLAAAGASPPLDGSAAAAVGESCLAAAGASPPLDGSAAGAVGESCLAAAGASPPLDGSAAGAGARECPASLHPNCLVVAFVVASMLPPAVVASIWALTLAATTSASMATSTHMNPAWPRPRVAGAGTRPREAGVPSDMLNPVEPGSLG